MKLSTKSRYGVRAMFDMAFHAGTLPAQIKDISRRQNISPRYLEQIFHTLLKLFHNLTREYSFWTVCNMKCQSVDTLFS